MILAVSTILYRHTILIMFVGNHFLSVFIGISTRDYTMQANSIANIYNINVITLINVFMLISDFQNVNNQIYMFVFKLARSNSEGREFGQF